MPELFIKDITRILKGKQYGKLNLPVKYLLIDSRKLVSPTESLFFAITGDRHDGSFFIDDLYQKQVRNFVVQILPASFEKYTGANFILVSNTLEALQRLAAYNRSKFSNPVIGITGSNGKTIIKEWLSYLLGGDKNIVRSPKSYNSQVGVPLSVWLLEPGFDIGLFEAGISKVGEMEKLEKIIKPDIVIISNIGEAHQENFINLEQKAIEKLKLCKNARTLIYCKDQRIIHREIKKLKSGKDLVVFSWSRDGTADLEIINIRKFSAKTQITGSFKNSTIEIEIPFLDDASVENAIHCWCLLLHLGYEQNYIVNRMKNLEPVEMRLELKHGINNCTLINDCYNSDVGSLKIALDFLDSQYQNDKKTLILSDIFQSGRNDNELYAYIAELVHKKKVDKIIGVGESLYHHAGLFKIEKKFFKSTDEFLSHFPKEEFRNEVVLLKGARDFEFERISGILEQQAHQTILEINLTSLVNNLNYFRSKLNAETRIMVMVKAFSYGTGSFEIANILQYQRVGYLAVAYSDEGVALRDAGNLLPIMVMNPEYGSFYHLLKYNLEPEIYSFHILESFAGIVRKNGIKTFPVHIKLDTGMHRLGFLPGEVDKLIEKLTKHPELHIKSIFSHLAASDEEIHDDYTRSQIKLFEKTSGKILSCFSYPILRHLLNSSGIERFPEAQYDMVRLGIGLYGISSVNQNKLTNVSTFKSKISQIKRIPANETVGYGRRGKANNGLTIAVIPAGYADGLSRKLGNGVGEVFINGKPAIIIGDICMDMCMIDVSGYDVNIGDEVELFGDKNPITRIAEKIGTIPYEVLTGISQRVKRVYYQE
jgi:alanine racemase